MQTSESLARSLAGEAPRSLGRQAGRGVMWNTAQSLVNRLSQFLAFALLARLLVPEDFGALAAANVLIGLVSVLADAGMTKTLIQKPDLEARHINAANLVSVASGTVLAATLVAIAPLAARMYGIPSLTDIVMVLAIAPFVNSLASTSQTILQRQLRFRTLVVLNSASTVVSNLIAVTCAFLGAGVWALVALSLSQTVIWSVLVLISAGWIPSVRTDLAAVREIIGFSSRVLGITLLGFANRRSVELLVGVTLGAAALGTYSVAFRVHSLILDMTVANLQRVALPIFARVAHDVDRLGSAYLRSTRLTTLVSFPFFVAMMLTGPELVPALFGEKWARAGILMAIVASVGPLQSLAQFTSSVLLASGRAKTAFRFSVANAVVTVVSFVIGVRFGLVGAALAYVASGYIVMPIGMALARRAAHVRLRDQAATFVTPLVGGAAMVGVIVLARMLTDARGAIWVASADLIALTAYAATVLTIRPQTVAELRSMLSSRRKRGARRRTKGEVTAPTPPTPPDAEPVGRPAATTSHRASR